MRASIDVAIFGAGPYGLSLAHGLAECGIEFRIFGRLLEAWKANMPPGMLLKSYPWASNLYAHRRGFTVKEFCSRRALPYHDRMMALSREECRTQDAAIADAFAVGVSRRARRRSNR